MEFNSKIKANLFRNSFLLTLLCIVSISLIGIVAAQTVAEPTVTKTVSPTDINLAGTGSNEETTVTLKVTGAGDTTSGAMPMDVVFAIDSSGSMGISFDGIPPSDPSNLRLNASKSFLDKMNSSRDMAGVVSWDNDVDFSQALTNNFATLNDKMDTIDHDGGTNLNAGLHEAINILDKDTSTGKAKVIIFLTDGNNSDGYVYNSEDAQNAANKGYIVYAIGLGGNVNTAPLKDMANKTGGKYYDSPSAANLQAIFDEIFKQVSTSTIPHYVDVVETTQDYIVNVSSFNVAPDSIANGSGITTITWKNIGKGDGSPDLSADEEIVLSFEAKSNKIGTDLPVDVLEDSKVTFKDSEGKDAGSVAIPQAYINVTEPQATASAETKDKQFRVGPTVRLRPLNSEINKSADGLVELFMNNPSLNDVTLEVDVSVDVPSDIYINAEDGGMSGGAGAITGHFTVPPGSSRTVTLHIKGEKTGTYNVHFGGMYWPGDNKDKWNPLSLDNSFAVEENSTPTPATTSKPLPGFEAASLVLVFMILFFVRRK
jgi:uncharacterized protein YegL